VKCATPASGVLNRSAFLLRLDEAIARTDGSAKRSRSCSSTSRIQSHQHRAWGIGGGRGRSSAWPMRFRMRAGTDFVGRLGATFGVVLNECDDPGPP